MPQRKFSRTKRSWDSCSDRQTISQHVCSLKLCQANQLHPLRNNSNKPRTSISTWQKHSVRADLFKSHNLLTNPILHFATAPQSDCEIRWLDMLSWGSKKAFAISLCWQQSLLWSLGTKRLWMRACSWKVLNKDPNVWLCVNKEWVQAIASNHFLPTFLSTNIIVIGWHGQSIALPQRAYTILGASNELALQHTRMNLYVK